MGGGGFDTIACDAVAGYGNAIALPGYANAMDCNRITRRDKASAVFGYAIAEGSYAIALAKLSEGIACNFSASA